MPAMRRGAGIFIRTIRDSKRQVFYVQGELKGERVRDERGDGTSGNRPARRRRRGAAASEIQVIFLDGTVVACATLSA